MALGAFYFRATEARRRFLCFAWGADKVNFWISAQRFTSEFYSQHRELLNAGSATSLSAVFWSIAERR